MFKWNRQAVSESLSIPIFKVISSAIVRFYEKEFTFIGYVRTMVKQLIIVITLPLSP